MRTLREMLSGGQRGEKKSSGHQAGSGRNDICRCEEVSEMKPRQLFGLMLSDLAFWKKAGKNAPSGMQPRENVSPERPGSERRR